MTQGQYIISRKVNILELGRTLGNISEACRKLGVSRQHYYDIRTAIEEEGLEGLLEKSRRVPRVGNRVPAEVRGAGFGMRAGASDARAGACEQRAEEARCSGECVWDQEYMVETQSSDEGFEA